MPLQPPQCNHAVEYTVAVAVGATPTRPVLAENYLATVNVTACIKCFFDAIHVFLQLTLKGTTYKGQGRMAQNLTADKFVELYTLVTSEWNSEETYRCIFYAVITRR